MMAGSRSSLNTSSWSLPTTTTRSARASANLRASSRERALARRVAAAALFRPASSRNSAALARRARHSRRRGRGTSGCLFARSAPARSSHIAGGVDSIGPCDSAMPRTSCAISLPSRRPGSTPDLRDAPRHRAPRPFGVPGSDLCDDLPVRGNRLERDGAGGVAGVGALQHRPQRAELDDQAAAVRRLDERGMQVHRRLGELRRPVHQRRQPLQQAAHALQVGVVRPVRGELAGVRLQRRLGVEHFELGDADHAQLDGERVGDVLHVALRDPGAAALAGAHVDDADRRQRAHGVAHGDAGDAELLRQADLGAEEIAARELAGEQRRAYFRHDRGGQGHAARLRRALREPHRILKRAAHALAAARPGTRSPPEGVRAPDALPSRGAASPRRAACASRPAVPRAGSLGVVDQALRRARRSCAALQLGEEALAQQHDAAIAEPQVLAGPVGDPALARPCREILVHHVARDPAAVAIVRRAVPGRDRLLLVRLAFLGHAGKRPSHAERVLVVHRHAPLEVVAEEEGVRPQADAPHGPQRVVLARVLAHPLVDEAVLEFLEAELEVAGRVRPVPALPADGRVRMRPLEMHRIDRVLLALEPVAGDVGEHHLHEAVAPAEGLPVGQQGLLVRRPEVGPDHPALGLDRIGGQAGALAARRAGVGDLLERLLRRSARSRRTASRDSGSAGRGAPRFRAGDRRPCAGSAVRPGPACRPGPGRGPGLRPSAAPPSPARARARRRRRSDASSGAAAPHGGTGTDLRQQAIGGRVEHRLLRVLIIYILKRMKSFLRRPACAAGRQRGGAARAGNRRLSCAADPRRGAVLRGLGRRRARAGDRREARRAPGAAGDRRQQDRRRGRDRLRLRRQGAARRLHAARLGRHAGHQPGAAQGALRPGQGLRARSCSSRAAASSSRCILRSRRAPISELVALTRASPGKLNYASAGVGSLVHLATEYFKMQTGADLVHIPHKGITAATTGLVTGDVAFMIVPTELALPHIKAGKIRPLAVSGTQALAARARSPDRRGSGPCRLQREPLVRAARAGGHAEGDLSPTQRRGHPDPGRAGDAEPARAAGHRGDARARRSSSPRLIAADLARWQKVVATANIVAE